MAAAAAAAATPLSMAGESIDDSDSSETRLLIHQSPNSSTKAEESTINRVRSPPVSTTRTSPTNTLVTLRVKTMDAKEHLIQVDPSASVGEVSPGCLMGVGFIMWGDVSSSITV